MFVCVCVYLDSSMHTCAMSDERVCVSVVVLVVVWTTFWCGLCNHNQKPDPKLLHDHAARGTRHMLPENAISI